jgi:hypothetical protein
MGITVESIRIISETFKCYTHQTTLYSADRKNISVQSQPKSTTRSYYQVIYCQQDALSQAGPKQKNTIITKIWSTQEEFVKQQKVINTHKLRIIKSTDNTHNKVLWLTLWSGVNQCPFWNFHNRFLVRT